MVLDGCQWTLRLLAVARPWIHFQLIQVLIYPLMPIILGRTYLLRDITDSDATVMEESLNMSLTQVWKAELGDQQRPDQAIKELMMAAMRIAGALRLKMSVMKQEIISLFYLLQLALCQRAQLLN